MKKGELIKILKKNNCYLFRHGTSHDIWMSPITNKKFPVPRHKNEMKKGTVNKILRQSGIK